MATKIKRNYIVLDTIILWAMMVYELTPITSDIPWLQNLLFALCMGLLMTWAVLLVIWSIKKQLYALLRFGSRDVRGALMFNMVLLAGAVTHYVAGEKRIVYLNIVLVIVSVLGYLIYKIPVKRSKNMPNKE